MSVAKKEKLLSESVRFRRMGIRAVRKAQEENRRLGIPNAFSHQDKLFFELPSGEITDQDPFEQKRDRE